MAKSQKSFGRSLDSGSEVLPEHFCEPCYEVDDTIKPVAGYCRNCNENLCLTCYTGHLRRKLFQKHILVDKSTRPKTKSTPHIKHQKFDEVCLLHQGETIQSFCQHHSQLCCKVCLSIDHQACKTGKISKLARNIQDSEELQNLIAKLNKLRKGYNESLSKTGANKSVIQRNHRDAINEINKLRDEFEKLMTETESQAEQVKQEDSSKIEKIAATCDVVIEQINKLTTNLDKLKENRETEGLFIHMKRAENQLQSLEENLARIDKDNAGREYKFQPDARLKTLFNDLNELGQILFEKLGNPQIAEQIKVFSPSEQIKKRPTYLKDIYVLSASETNASLFDTLMLPNKQILTTDWENMKLKLIDTDQDIIISELQLADNPYGITKVNDHELAVTFPSSKKIQFISKFQNTLSIGREISVNGSCNGLAYNEKDDTLIVVVGSQIQILNMAGSVIKCLDKDSKGDPLLCYPYYVGLNPTMTGIYVTDNVEHSITFMTISEDEEFVYTDFSDDSLQNPQGIYTHKSGIVYVVGEASQSVHQLDQESGEFKLLLDNEDGLDYPISISYSEWEDKMYIGMRDNSILKVFQMK